MSGHLRDATNESPTSSSSSKRRPPKIVAPAWLSKSGKVYFARIVRDIEEHTPDLIGRLDTASLALLAEVYSVAQAAARAMRGPGNEPAILETDHAHGSQNRKTPAWQVFAQAMARFETLAREFGLTPAARARLELEPGGLSLPDDQDDELDIALG